VALSLGVSTVLLALVATAPQPIQPLLRTSTGKSVDAFGSCFTAAQEKASRAWAYMPSEQGGMFTNSGAAGSTATYWLSVNSSAHRGEIRLFGDEGARPSNSLIEAVDQCR
jgi:hypothetical protein